MTTKVIVFVPSPNHKPVNLIIQDKAWADGVQLDNWNETSRQQIGIGEMREVYVHDSRRIVVEEMQTVV